MTLLAKPLASVDECMLAKRRHRIKTMLYIAPYGCRQYLYALSFCIIDVRGRFSLGLDLRISRIARVQVGSREKTVYVETAAAALRCFSSYNDRVYAFCPGGFCR